jgi:DNA-binding CsgD family transcriptional regulator
MLKTTPLMPPFPRRAYVPHLIELSDRELEILRWMSAGKSDWDIGIILKISKKTVNWHVDRIKRRFAVPTRIQTVLLAERLGLLEPQPATCQSPRHRSTDQLWRCARRYGPIDFERHASFHA